MSQRSGVRRRRRIRLQQQQPSFRRQALRLVTVRQYDKVGIGSDVQNLTTWKLTYGAGK